MDDKDAWFSTAGEAQKRSAFGGAIVRRRRWFRVRKRKINIVLSERGRTQRTFDSVDYVTRASAILTDETLVSRGLEDGIVKWRGELHQFESALQILLSGIKVDQNEGRKKDATERATALLSQAELLADKIASEQLRTRARKAPIEPEARNESVDDEEESTESQRDDVGLPKEPPIVSCDSNETDAVVFEEQPPLEEANEPNEETQPRRSSDSDWKASILASAGWRCEGTAFEIDTDSPSLPQFPLLIQDPNGGRWISNDALEYTEEIDDDGDEDREPIWSSGSPTISPFVDFREDDSQDVEISNHPSAPNTTITELQSPTTPRIAPTSINVRPSISTKTPLVPTTTQIRVRNNVSSPVTVAQNSSSTSAAIAISVSPIADQPIARLDLRKMSVASISSFASAEEFIANEGSSNEGSPYRSIVSTAPSPAIAIPQYIGGSGEDINIHISTPNGWEGGPVPNAMVPAMGSSFGNSIGTIGRERSPVGSWQSSETAVQCKHCKRKFSLFLRKHHCRWCGFVFCDTCSNHRVALSNGSEQAGASSDSQQAFHRVCDTCYTFLTNANDSPLYTNPMTRPSPPAHLSNSYRQEALLSSSSSSSSALDLIANLSQQFATAFTSVVSAGIPSSSLIQTGADEEEDVEDDEGDDLLTPSAGGVVASATMAFPKRNMSDSVMLECPVCQLSLLKMKTASEAESHVAECLTKSSPEISGNRYIVQTLKESVDGECVICFNDMKRMKLLSVRLSFSIPLVRGVQARWATTASPAVGTPYGSLVVGAPKESFQNENRVALTPNNTKLLLKKGFSKVLVEKGAGLNAQFTDKMYQDAGATLVSAEELFNASDILLKVRPPSAQEAKRVKEASTVISFLYAARNQPAVDALKSRNATALGMEMIPRISRAQVFDALSSMANIAGYKAVLEASNHFGSFLTGQITAAGKIPPGKVLVIGAGVAGLSAVVTARRLGAIVRAFDTRSAAREQVESLGAEFLEVAGVEESGDGGGGYAKEMSPAFIAAEMKLFMEQCREVDIVITTALIPAKPAPN
ncbi:UNVERIFIED_CONTAM: hypothetical protein HDU68_012369 [Siphonaria sp. JEL0065]|nr:hypothetical protein HDU68_012369 [Siphonaria sp. JEL0065]